MALKNKIPWPSNSKHFSSRYGTPPEQGEFVLGVKSAEPKEKKKSKRQLESEELATHMKDFEARFKREQEERIKLLGELPF